MTDAAQFGRLESVALRTAWVHEATAFTPWLAQNLDRLGEALGIPIELVQTEAPVTTFSADILARNASDGSIILIENQLEDSDHGHLGQILTYLAGLEAETVVWVAPRFKDAHISAIRWLNQHTGDRFSFFAVEVRVVRIGASPLAPLFEIVERPNDWERAVQQQAQQSRQLSDVGEFRKAFWTHLLARHAEESAAGRASAAHHRWRPVTSNGLVVVQYLAQDSVGVFIRGRRAVAVDTTAALLAPRQRALESALFASINENNFFFLKKFPVDTSIERNWDRMADWLHEQADLYTAALERLVGA